MVEDPDIILLMFVIATFALFFMHYSLWWLVAIIGVAIYYIILKCVDKLDRRIAGLTRMINGLVPKDDRGS